MDFIEIMKEFGTQIIVAISGVGIMTMILFAIRYVKPIFENIVKPLFDVFRKETKDKLQPLEDKLDAFLNYLAHDAQVKSKNPTISEYDKEKYEEFASILIKLKNIDITTQTIEKSNIIEETIDKGIETVESFLDRNKG